MTTSDHIANIIVAEMDNNSIESTAFTDNVVGSVVTSGSSHDITADFLSELFPDEDFTADLFSGLFPDEDFTTGLFSELWQGSDTASDGIHIGYDAAPKSNILAFPGEIKLQILKNLRSSDTQSLALSCKDFYTVFLEHRNVIGTDQIMVEMSELGMTDLGQMLVAHQAARSGRWILSHFWDCPASGATEYIDDFCTKYLNRKTGLLKTARKLSHNEARGVLAFHDGVEELTSRYCTEHMEPHGAMAPNEKQRVIKAIYILEITHCLFNNPEMNTPRYNLVDYREKLCTSALFKIYWQQFAPWEAAQAAKIRGWVYSQNNNMEIPMESIPLQHILGIPRLCIDLLFSTDTFRKITERFAPPKMGVYPHIPLPDYNVWFPGHYEETEWVRADSHIKVTHYVTVLDLNIINQYADDGIDDGPMRMWLWRATMWGSLNSTEQINCTLFWPFYRGSNVPSGFARGCSHVFRNAATASKYWGYLPSVKLCIDTVNGMNLEFRRHQYDTCLYFS